MDSLVLPDDHVLCMRRLLDRVASTTESGISRGVVHLGAHEGEEVDTYRDYGFGSILLVEANPNLIQALKQRFEHYDAVQIVHAAATDCDGETEIMIHQTNSGSVASSSLLALNKLAEIVPIFNSEQRYRVPGMTLQSIAADYDLFGKTKLLTIDIQGAELMVLQAGLEFVSSVDAVICEVNLIENYHGCALEPEVDELFAELGFRKELALYHELYDASRRFPAWGECVWINQRLHA